MVHFFIYINNDTCCRARSIRTLHSASFYRLQSSSCICLRVNNLSSCAGTAFHMALRPSTRRLRTFTTCYASTVRYFHDLASVHQSEPSNLIPRPAPVLSGFLRRACRFQVYQISTGLCVECFTLADYNIDRLPLYESRCRHS